MSMYALLALALPAPAIPAADAPYLQRDQQRAWEARREGRILPLPEIERRGWDGDLGCCSRSGRVYGCAERDVEIRTGGIVRDKCEVPGLRTRTR